MMVVVLLVNHNLPLVDSRGDKKAHQKVSFYGICLTFQAVISLHYTFFFIILVSLFMHIILMLLYHVYITNIYK